MPSSCRVANEKPRAQSVSRGQGGESLEPRVPDVPFEGREHSKEGRGDLLAFLAIVDDSQVDEGSKSVNIIFLGALNKGYP